MPIGSFSDRTPFLTERCAWQTLLYHADPQRRLSERIHVQRCPEKSTSDGARWIATWATGIEGVEVIRILCWYHLCKRVYEGLSGLGLPKEERKQLEREILGHFWRGEHCLAVWKLWGLRDTARKVGRLNAKRLDDLIGYLLRKKDGLANYSERRERGEWIASTRVEKWNDIAVAERCKHRGSSWTKEGVLEVAAYAEKTKENHTRT